MSAAHCAADSARSGFYQNETFLTPANVASSLGPVWQSPVLDGHLYASPLLKARKGSSHGYRQAVLLRM